jgi:hypothetical protein
MTRLRVALDQTAADNAADAFLSAVGSTLTGAARASVKSDIAKLFKAIFDGIIANAEVTPDGTPHMKDGGTNDITGKGRIT